MALVPVRVLISARLPVDTVASRSAPARKRLQRQFSNTVERTVHFAADCAQQPRAALNPLLRRGRIRD